MICNIFQQKTFENYQTRLIIKFNRISILFRIAAHFLNYTLQRWMSISLYWCVSFRAHFCSIENKRNLPCQTVINKLRPTYITGSKSNKNNVNPFVFKGIWKAPDLGCHRVDIHPDAHQEWFPFKCVTHLYISFVFICDSNLACL